jgi:hypothetical protein
MYNLDIQKRPIYIYIYIYLATILNNILYSYEYRGYETGVYFRAECTTLKNPTFLHTNISWGRNSKLGPIGREMMKQYF